MIHALPRINGDTRTSPSFWYILSPSTKERKEKEKEKTQLDSISIFPSALSCFAPEPSRLAVLAEETRPRPAEMPSKDCRGRPVGFPRGSK